MAEDTKEPVPANAPWKIGWKAVAKESGVELPPAEPPKTAVETITSKVKPWLMDWGILSSKSQEKAPSKPVTPNTTKYATEKQAVESAQFTPEEIKQRDAYLKSPEHINELKAEIAAAPHPEAKAALTEALKTAMKK